MYRKWNWGQVSWLEYRATAQIFVCVGAGWPGHGQSWTWQGIQKTVRRASTGVSTRKAKLKKVYSCNHQERQATHNRQEKDEVLNIFLALAFTSNLSSLNSQDNGPRVEDQGPKSSTLSDKIRFMSMWRTWTYTSLWDLMRYIPESWWIGWCSC